MTWVKICGITNLEDAQVAVDAGADAVGFVLYEKSPRCVSEEAVREIAGQLPKNVEKVGVFVGDLQASEIAVRCGLQAVQFYVGAFEKPLKWADPQYAKMVKHYWAVPSSTFINSNFAKQNLESVVLRRHGAMWESNDAIFVDSGMGQRPGGTGDTFDWREAESAFKILNSRLRAVVAGGLTPENVGEAMAILHPWGVDVASGVEARPGKKDPEKVRAFVRAVREHDRGSAAV
jgi:phosphoribosylanthranilate isomerase